MRGRSLPLSFLTLGLSMLLPVGSARADFATPTQIQDIYNTEKSYATGTSASSVLPTVPLQTDWKAGTPITPGSKTLINDPFQVHQFDASKYNVTDSNGHVTQFAVLTQVVVALSYQFQNQVQMTFNTASTSTVTAQGVMHLDAVGANGQTINDIVNTPTFWTQKTLSYPTETKTASYLQPLAQALTVSSVSAIGYKDSSTLNMFSGTGAISMPVIATAQSSYTNSSGNGAGGSITTAYAALSVTYYYNLVPEPSSVVLMGLGSIGLGLVSRARMRREEKAAV